METLGGGWGKRWEVLHRAAGREGATDRAPIPPRSGVRLEPSAFLAPQRDEESADEGGDHVAQRERREKHEHVAVGVAGVHTLIERDVRIGERVVVDRRGGRRRLLPDRR